MADEPRLTKKERRERARADRRAEEERKAKEARKRALRSGAITTGVLAAIGLAVYFAVTGNTAEGDVLIDPVAAQAAQDEAGCVPIEQGAYEERTHLQPATAPPADVLYPDFRPTHSGPHFETWFPVQADGLATQPDERQLTHNLEHGAIIAWYDPEQVDGDDLDSWAESRNDAGFLNSRGGAAIFTAPYTEPGITDDRAVALRAWGVGLDCDAWDRDVADAFVINWYGTHGNAPERTFAPYPEEALQFTDGEVGDSDAPLDGEGDTGESPEPDETDLGDGATDEATTDEAGDNPDDAATTDDAGDDPDDPTEE